MLVGLFLYFGPYEIPASLKDSSFSSLTRANVAHLVKQNTNSTPPRPPVDEIYGLLHLVTQDDEHQHVLSNAVDMDPTKPVDMAIYAASNTDIDWYEEMERLDREHPIFVFSKTYCPYSKRAKGLLNTYNIQPPPYIVEVDIRDDSNVLKALLTRLTHHTTFPNIVVRGKSIGGNDQLQALHENNSLLKILQDAGATAKSP